MGPSRHTGRDRRPPAPGRPLPLTAAGTGVATALVAAVAAVAAVAVVWLPASGSSGGAGSTIRAGLITFLAGLHGGVAVDGLASAFVPLGLTVAVGALCWRATAAVVDAAYEDAEPGRGELLRAVGAQVTAFALTCAILASGATLGTSSASVGGSFVAAVVLSGLVGGAVLVRQTELGDELLDAVPRWLPPALRCGMAALTVYLVAGAVVVAGSLVVHHERVVTLSREIGGGWSSVPVLLLGVLAVPNAVIAGSGYLSGAGFAVGSGTGVGLTGATLGTVPAFPLLGALPDGSAPLPVWLLAVVVPFVAGGCIAVLAGRAPSGAERWRDAGLGVLTAALGAAVLAWQGGGAIGDAGLSAVGVSPWRFAVAVAIGTGAATAALLGLRAAVATVRAREHDERPGLRATIAALTSVEDYDTEDTEDTEDPDDTDESGGSRPGDDTVRRDPLAG